MTYDYIKELKDKRKITNQQLSDLSGVPLSSLTRILTGQTENPSFQSICDIVTALGGSIDEMTGIKSAEPQPVQNNPVIKLMEKVIENKDKWLFRMFVACCVVVLFVFSITIADILNGTIGFVRYG